MRWHHIATGRGVLELDPGSLFPTADVGAEIELMVWYGPDVPTRAAWLWSQSGRIAAWAVVGEA